MEKNKELLLRIKEKQMMKAFSYNNMSLMFVKDKKELYQYLQNVLKDSKKVAVGGSATLNELGVIDYIRESDVHFIDRYEEGLSQDELENRLREGFFADVFLTSTNALTTDGCLYNIDGTGNRVAAMIYGPKEVIVIAGLNKIFESEEAAIEHIKTVSAPANAIRLNRKTPCAKVGKCQNCLSDDRICCSYVKLAYQRFANRIKVIIVEEELGY